VLVGVGNNGGDGLVAGRVIAEQSQAQVRFYLLKKRADDDPLLKAVRDKGLLVTDAEDDQRYRVLHHMVGSAHLLIDALFGIGVRLPLQGEAAKVLQAVQRALSDLQAIPQETPIIDPALPKPRESSSVPYILAIDCPSGLDCDTGAIDNNAIPADETVTFIAAKPGLLIFPGAAAVGKLVVSTIGVPDDLSELKAEKRVLIDGEYVRQWLPKRAPNSHKGTYGKALIVAGSANYIGAPGMSAQAAYRAGAGLVTVAAPQHVVNSLSVRLYEPTWLTITPQDAPQKISDVSKGYDSILLGPGWGQEDATRDLLAHLLDHATFTSLVIDADGLNLLAQLPEWWKRLPKNTVITPHPGEMARLSGLDTEAVQNNRWALATEKAAEWNIILVLKGAHTLIAAPDGQIAALPFKTDALAKAGTGDVLAGIITGLLAQGIDAFDAAVCGGYVHGLAGELAAQLRGSTRSVLASDVIDVLGQAFERIEKG
jgi:ADP-dependent NAD(P)H-hydrate dehydratase / NAD(P)H-hydrate epimerase